MGALSELPEVDHHNMMLRSVIKIGSKMENSRRSIKDKERVEKGRFKKRRRKGIKKRIINRKKQLVQDGSYSTKLKETNDSRLKKRRRSKRCFLEKEIYYRKRKIGINISISPLIIYSLLFNLMQVLAQQYRYQQHNTSPIKVVQAFQPTIELTTNDKDGLHFNKHFKPGGFDVEREELSLRSKKEREIVNLVGTSKASNEKKIEEEKFKFEKHHRPKRLKRNIKLKELLPSERGIHFMPTSEQMVYDATVNLAEQSAEMVQNEQQRKRQQFERRQERSIEKAENRQQQQQQHRQQQTGNCSEYNEIEPELGSEAAKIRQLLSRYYRLESSLAIKRPSKITDQGIDKASSDGGGSNLDNVRVLDERKSNGKLELPRPSNVSVLIISWYPPILKLSWNLNELSEGDISRLNFYENNSDTTSSASSSSSASRDNQEKDLLSEFDLELAIDNASEERRTISDSNDPERRQNGTTETEGVDRRNDNLRDGDEDDDDGASTTLDTDIELARELKRRRFLVRKSLTCFQITYNIINSRFKIIEEYPPYLRSIMLERLLPATEYSLHVVAVYLNRYRLFSERVQFVSPTDNESRRFKEGTYRPIHRYPDEPKHHLRYGLAQVRSEELTIVAIALMFWIATICLFFNKWGKIRMLEPYQPAYRESSSTTFAVHHHPSIHNMQNCSPGSGSNGTGVNGSVALAGIGAKMGGICGGVGLGAPIFETMPPICSQPPVSQQQQQQQQPIQPASVVTTVNQSAAGDICVGQQQQKQQDGVLPVDITAQASAPTKVGLTNVTSGGTVAGSQYPHDIANIEQQQQRSFDSSTRKLSRGLLVRGRKRFETVGDEPLVPIKQRTNDELNYLFQTKAQALVRATALWSMKQQQKLQRQQQLCARLAESENQKRQQQQQQDEFEMLRRTSQVSSMLRQRHYSNQQQPLVPSAGGALIMGPFCQTQTRDQSGGVAVQRPMNLEVKERPEIEEECKQQQQQQHALRKQSIVAAAATTTPTTTTTGRRDPRNQSLKYHRQSRAFDYTTTTRSGATNSLDSQPHSGSHCQSGQDSASSSNCREIWTRTVAQSEEVGSSNKLRRLMFLSKTHQHHHIATSISSSTLMNNASFSGGTTSSNNGRRFSASQLLESSSLKLNSVSVDSGSQEAANSNCDVHNDDADDSKGTHSNCEELTSQSDLRLTNRGRQMRNMEGDQDGGGGEVSFQDLCVDSLPSEVDSQGQKDLRRSKTSLDSNKSTGKSEQTMVGLNEIEIKVPNSGDNKPVEHHILIEPPSPPYQPQQAETSDLMAKSSEDTHQRNERRGSSEFDKTGECMTEFTSRPSQQSSYNSRETFIESDDEEFHEEPSWLKSDDKTQITVREIKLPRLITPESGTLTELGPDKVAPNAWQRKQQQQQQQQQKRRSSESASQVRIQIETAKERRKGSKQNLHSDSEGWPKSFGHTGEASLLRGPLGKQSEPNWKSRPEICFQEASPISFNKFDEFSKQEEDIEDDNGEDEEKENGEEDEDVEMKNKGLLKKEGEAASKNKGSDTADDAFVKLAEYTARKHSRNAHTHSLSHTSVQLSQKADYLRHQSFCAGVGIGIGAVPDFACCPAKTVGSNSYIQTYGGSSCTIHSSNYPATVSTQQRQHRLHLAPACSCGSGNISNLDGQLRAPLLYETVDNEDMLPETDNNNNNNNNNNLNTLGDQAGGRGRISSVFAGSQYSRAHRDSFAMLRALSQKKSKSAEDVAYLSNLVLQIWVRDRNPLLQSASQQQLSLSRRQSSSQERNLSKQRRPKSSLNVSHL